MIGPGEFGQGMARAQRSRPMELDLKDLEDKWSTTSEDEPLCAACGKRIAGEDDDGMPEVPVRLWRKGGTEGLALHPKCFNARFKK